MEGNIMKTFEVVLTKSYIVRIKAESAEDAKEYSELFTGDIHDISSFDDRIKLNFEIIDIECKINDSIDVQEL